MITDSDKSNIDFIFEAFMLIMKEKGGSGLIVCPKCKGTLKWTRASNNKHVWGKCQTTDCLSWMQ